MPVSDMLLVFQWWSVLFILGVAAFPFTKRLFHNWYDRGYFFSKAVGMAVVSYIVFFLGTMRIAPFTFSTVVGAIGFLFIFGTILVCRTHRTNKTNTFAQVFSFARRPLVKLVFIVLLEEAFFFCSLLVWSWVKAHEPSIQGLEKFMDYGFMQSILNSWYFPASDMWWAGGAINYYYFGHLVTAVLTRLSGLDLSVTFNLMLATLFALTLTMSFSIGIQLQQIVTIKDQKATQIRNQTQRILQWVRFLVAGVVTSFLVTLAGNMQTIYAFTKGYLGDNVVAFWTILWSRQDFFPRLGEGMLRYWYANATRFIPFTIHEFPGYSFVVSDVHGHVLSIPFVLLAIAIIISFFSHTADKIDKTHWLTVVFYGFLVGVLLMTNALDGPIYGLLFGLFIAVHYGLQITDYGFWKKLILPLGVVGIIAFLTAFPFLVHFKSFASGIGVNCPPEILANTSVGPFLFEEVEKCQKSPLWMMELLWGFFWFTGIWLFVRQMWGKDQYDGITNRILKVFYIYGIALIIIPEFLYVKDIYPTHFRSNTMFKLGYEAFIMWSIIAGYVMVHFLFMKKRLTGNDERANTQNTNTILRKVFFVLLIPQLFLVSIYPIFSIRSYFGELRTYRGIYGLSWLVEKYPDDVAAIQWLKNQIQEKQGSPSTAPLDSLRWFGTSLRATMTGVPVIVEADGESYTDYNHISAFSGIPTIVGWAVHEWLWRGSHDIVVPRREDVRTIYESPDLSGVRAILAKYHVRYIIIGKLEREKYPQLDEQRIAGLGTMAFQSGSTVIYDVSGQ